MEDHNELDDRNSLTSHGSANADNDKGARSTTPSDAGSTAASSTTTWEGATSPPVSSSTHSVESEFTDHGTPPPAPAPGNGMGAPPPPPGFPPRGSSLNLRSLIELQGQQQQPMQQQRAATLVVTKDNSDEPPTYEVIPSSTGFPGLMETVTPLRAIDKFFINATPVSSPDTLDENWEPPKNLVSQNEEVITPVVSSQSSQKRKLNDEVLSQGNVSKRKSVEETLTHSFQDDSVSDSLEFPSNLGSPSLVFRPVQPKTNRKRMSNSAFIKVLKSDQLGQQSQVVNTSDDLGESNIPSDLGSPDKLLLRRPEDVSLQSTTKILLETQTKASDSDLSDDSDMSELESSSEDLSPSTSSSATLPNRAIQPSTSISSLAVSVTSGASKSPTQQQSDLYQTFFGSKQNKVLSAVSEDPVVQEKASGAAIMATADAAVLHASSPPSLVPDGVPSIITQDSFVLEQPSLSPSASPPSSKLYSGTVPVPKTRNAKNQEVPVEVDLPAIIPQARQRKDLATIDEIPTMEVNSQPAGEEANVEFDTGQSLSARPRMSALPPHPSSFPVGVVMNDEHVARPLPVPKPRTVFFLCPPSPTTSLEMWNERFASLPSSDEFPIIQQQPVVTPRNVIDDKHDHKTAGLPSESPPPKPVRASNAIELNNDETSEEEDEIQEEALSPKSIRVSNAVELYDDETTVDFDTDKTIIAVEGIEEEMVRAEPHQTSGCVEEIPVNSSPKEIRGDRDFSFLHRTPTSETDNSSQGFRAFAEHLSYRMTAASNSDHGKTMDSAVYLTGENNQAPEDSPSESTSHFNYKTALNRPLSEIFVAPQVDFTPPTATPPLLKPATVQTPLSHQSTASNRAELSWDNNEMPMLHQTPDAWTGWAGSRRSIVAFEPVEEETKARSKLISLESPSCDQSAGSPITKDDEDEADAGEQAVSANSNESPTSPKSKKMTAFFQGILGGENKPANNNTNTLI